MNKYCTHCIGVMSEDKSSEISQKRPMIRPPTNQLMCKDLIKKLYNFDVKQIKELNGYDDRNYYVMTSDSNEFILKITNSLESSICGLIDAFNSLILYLDLNHIKVTVPIINTYAKYVSYEDIWSEDSNSTSTYAVRLLKYIPGIPLYDIPYTPSILRECGAFLAKLTNALQTFDNEVLRSRKIIWSLLSLPNLREYLIAVNDEFRKTIVLDTISQFESQVLSRIDDFDRGIIHGDYNEQNIIVQKKDDCDQWFVNGVIDFGDVHFGPKIFDLAIFLTYTMLECKSFDPLLAPGFGISGYLQFRKIKVNELKFLFICIKSRLCQSLVMGAYSHRIDPTNQYILTTAKTGWTVLERLHATDQNELLNKWLNIENEFN